MKILSKAVKPVKLWWLGLRYECQTCGEMVELEAEDNTHAMVRIENNPNGPTVAHVQCSGCRKWMKSIGRADVGAGSQVSGSGIEAVKRESLKRGQVELEESKTARKRVKKAAKKKVAKKK